MKHKKIIAAFIVCILIYFFNTQCVYATQDAEEWPIDFTAGLNSEYANNFGKMSVVIPVLLDIYGVEVSNTGVNDYKMSIYTLLNNLKGYDSALYNYIDAHSTVEYTAGRYVVSFADGFLNLAASGSVCLRDFFEWLCGDAAVSGNQFENTILNNEYITVNGVSVIPWRSNRELSRMFDSQDVNIFPIRGSYIIPSYFSQWYDIYSASNHQKKLTFDIVNSNGETVSVSTVSNFVARSTESTTDGNVKDLRYTIGGRNYSMFYAAPSTNSYAAQAYLPVITYDGYFCICSYTYLYSGTITPGSWPKHTYLLLPITNAQVLPYTYNAGSSTYSGQLNTGEITNNIYNLYGDTYETVINNYYTGDPVVQPHYTDPFSWDTGGGGHITQDGDGWTFDLDGFHLPDLNIDWNIDGLSDKFPFSIPFDLMHFLAIFNVEPETPHFEGTIDFGIKEIDVDLDLSYFDDLAEIVRNLEFVGFCIMLIYATRSIIGG